MGADKMAEKRVKSGAASRRGRSRAGCLVSHTPGYGIDPDVIRLARLHRAPGACGRPGAAAAISSRSLAACGRESWQLAFRRPVWMRCVVRRRRDARRSAGA